MSEEIVGSSESGQSSLKDLQKEVEILKLKLQKTTQLVAETGSQLLALQVEKTKSNLSSFHVSGGNEKDNQTSSSTKNISVDNSKMVHIPEEDPGLANALTSEDVVDLVAELQGQLDILDERSVRRTANSWCTQDDQAVAPLPGRDGEFPEEADNFPKTLLEFKQLSPDRLQYWLKWYEILPPDEEEMQEILEGIGTSIEQVGDYTKRKIENQVLSSQDLLSYSDDLARFLGLRTRNFSDGW